MGMTRPDQIQDVPTASIDEAAAERLISKIQAESKCDYRMAVRKASKQRPDLFGLVASDPAGKVVSPHSETAPPAGRIEPVQSQDQSGIRPAEVASSAGAGASVVKVKKPELSPEMQKQLDAFRAKRA